MTVVTVVFGYRHRFPLKALLCLVLGIIVDIVSCGVLSRPGRNTIILFGNQISDYQFIALLYSTFEIL
jgi:hypothetical protein